MSTPFCFFISFFISTLYILLINPSINNLSSDSWLHSFLTCHSIDEHLEYPDAPSRLTGCCQPSPCRGPMFECPPTQQLLRAIRPPKMSQHAIKICSEGNTVW